MTKSKPRRAVLTGIGAVITTFAGCHGTGGPEPADDVRLAPVVWKESGRWKLQVRVLTIGTQAIHDIEVVAFDKTGTQVCNHSIGDSPQGTGIRETATISCAGFPFLVTSRAREDPCDPVKFPIYKWVGPRENKAKQTYTDSEEIHWEKYLRKCNKELPPERLLPEE